ncbi:hypothetical protein BCR44DRAFT_38152 [Catenaria anguillulae PL171]|uniref:MAPEG family-domain-containing protein n=1 Tax=Catenaria anguillulae PL171 TaxID=765915 RepID=A0A1Y2I309_9FUNG|nr:hypothetical protein BCR44DRAFT_38152 [Catenaria anguillulae PL171]
MVDLLTAVLVYSPLFLLSWSLAAMLIKARIMHAITDSIVAHSAIDRPAVPFAALAAAIVLAHIVSPYAAYILQMLQNGYMNPENPRASRNTLASNSMASRAAAAHYNLLEGLPAFVAAVIVAHARKVDLQLRTSLAILHVFARIFHYTFYLTNRPYLRFVAYQVGLAAIAYLFGYSLATSVVSFDLTVSKLALEYSPVGKMIMAQMRQVQYVLWQSWDAYRYA